MISKQSSANSFAPRRRNGTGFTLIELVVVIAVIGLLLGAILTPLATQFQVRNNQQAERRLNDLKQALIGFAMTNGRLPCPDTDATPDGLENAPCTGSPEGFLPWTTLGVDAADNWGRLYRYRVTPEFTFAALAGTPPAASQLDLDDNGNITVIDRTSDKSQITLTDTAPAVIVSLGGNGYGGRDTDGNTLVAPTGADEQANVNAGSATFVRRGHSRETSPCSDTGGATPFCEYDDLIIWVPEPLLKSRLVEAGRLP